MNFLTSFQFVQYIDYFPDLCTEMNAGDGYIKIFNCGTRKSLSSNGSIQYSLQISI